MDTKNRTPFAAAFLVTALLSVMIVLCVSSMWRKSLTFDEKTHCQFGEKIIEGKLEAADMQKMPVSVLNALPLHVLKHWNIAPSSRARILISRVPTVLSALLLAYFVFRWAVSLYGLKAGLFAMMCCTFCPTILAHSRFVTNDLFCATLMLISTYFFVEYLKNPTLKRWLLSAVMFSLAQLTKQTALLLVPIFFLLFVLHRKDEITEFFHFKDLKSKFSKFGNGMCYLLLFIFIFLVILSAGYGFGDVLVTFGQLAEHNPDVFREPFAQKLLQAFPHIPLPLPKVYLESLFLGYHYNAQGIGHGSIYLLGKLSQKGWWYYFPVAVILKFPISFFLMFGMSVFVWAKNRKRRKKLADLSLIIPVLIIFLFFSLFCTAQIGIRYLLPILPFLYIFVSQIVTHEPCKVKFAYTLGVPLLFFWFAASSLSYHPHYLSYFNEFIGNRTNIYKYLADSNVDWGQNQYYLEKYLTENSGKNIKVLTPKRTTGTVVINVNELVGISSGPRKYRWIRSRYKPVAHIAYSWLVFEVPARPHSWHSRAE